jgi:hypothetical protein
MTGDEILVHNGKPKTSWKSTQCKHLQSPANENQDTTSGKKVDTVIFCDSH